MLKLLAILVILGTTAGLSYHASHRHGIEQLQTAGENQLSLLSTQVFVSTDKFNYLPKFVALYQSIEEALLHPGDRRRIQKASTLLEHLNTQAGSSAIYLMNNTGLTIASSNWNTGNNFVGKNFGFRPYFTDAMSNGQGQFYAMGISTGLPGYYIAQRVQKGDKILGVVVVKVDITDVNTSWKQQGREVTVTDEHGVIFISSRQEWEYRPMWPLSDSTKNVLKNTRKYEGVLQEALPFKLKKSFPPDGQILRLVTQNRWYGDQSLSYFSKSRTLPNSEWSVHILVPLDKIEENARKTAITAVGALTLLIFLGMYLIQIRIRAWERKESRRALEQAHQTLEQNHRELQALNEELRIQSITDPLTGLTNRRFFMEAVEKLTSSANRYRYPLTIIMIDVDHFKRINDAHGHPAGDKVLQTIAALYREEMREADILARFGGEEFIIALPHTDEPAAYTVAERIRLKVMNTPVHVAGNILQITVSCGLSQHKLNESDIKDTIKRADSALYEAKHGGRNKVVVAP